MTKIVALYARVSTTRQEKEETIASQIDEIRRRIKQAGDVLPEENLYVDDGWSGTTLQRPALDKLRDAANRKEFEVLYVYDRGRLSRQFVHQELLIEELKEKFISFVSLHDVAASTPEESLTQSFQGLFHEYERIKIGERMRRGKMYKARNGNIVNGDAPYGYTYILKTKEKNSHYVINPREAENVRKIFNWVADEGMTINRVIKKLHEEKIMPRQRKRTVWSNGPLSRLLRNEAYIGIAYYNKLEAVAPKHPKSLNKYKKVKLSSRKLRPRSEWIPIKVPAIVDRNLFTSVQEQLARNAQFAMRFKKHEYLLSGLIWCNCGSRMFGEGGIKHYYYRCTDRLKKYPLPAECTAGGINIRRIEGPVWQKIHDLLTNPMLLEKQINGYKQSHSEKMSQNVAILKKQSLLRGIARLKSEEKRYTKAYGEGLISLDIFREYIKDIAERRDKILDEIVKVDRIVIRTDSNLPPSDYIRERIPKVLSDLLLEEKQFVLRKVIKEIVVNRERTSATIRGLIPLQVLDENYELQSESRHRRASQCR